MRRSALAAITLAAAMAIAGCGSDSNADDTASDAPAGSGSSSVEVNSTSLGEVLTDGEGITLYMFDGDDEDMGGCVGECLALWPPLEGEPEAGDGAEAGLVGTIGLDDGTTQATYAGHPLYYYAEDGAAGDVKGQGIDDVWWVLDASGSPVEEAPPSDDADTYSGGDY